MTDRDTIRSDEDEADMRATIFQMLRAYLDDEIDFDTFEDRFVPLAWESRGADLDTVDQVTAEIACVKDGVLDEDTFRARMSEIVAQPAPSR